MPLLRIVRSFVLTLAFLGAYALSGCGSGPAEETTRPSPTAEAAPSSDGETAESAAAETAPSPIEDSGPVADQTSDPKAASKNGKTGGEFPAGITDVALLDRDVLSRRKPIVVTFTDPMIPAEALDKPVSVRDMPFSIHPPVAGEGRWLTRQSFVFTADEDYWPGKKYSLLFHEDLRSLDGRPTRMYYSFTTAAPEVNWVRAVAFDAANLKQKIYLDFSLPVRPEALAEHLEATDSRSGETLGLAPDGPGGESSSHSVFVDLGVYRPEITLTLRVDRDDDSSPLGLSAPHSFSFRLPDPGGQTSVTRATGGAGKASPLSLGDPYSFEDEQGEIFVCFPLSESLAGPGDWQEFIEVSPDLPYSFRNADTLIFREGVKASMRLTVTLKPGLIDGHGSELKKELSRSMIVPDHRTGVRFAEPGHFLSPLFGGRVGLLLVNVDEITVTLQRQYDNNLPFMTLDPDSRAGKMMRTLAVRQISVKGGKRNEKLRRSLDLEELSGGKKGVFLLNLTGMRTEEPADESHNNYAPGQSRLVVLSDIGITARTFPAGITVFAASLGSAAPLSDAEVKVYSASNQLIARGRTGENGVFAHQRRENWDEQLQPALVTVQYGGGGEEDLNFLPLNRETGIRESSGLQSLKRPDRENGPEAFVYTPRGLFRPGETVDVKAFVRDAGHMAPAPFPAYFRVLSPQGLEVAAGSCLLSDEGGADFRFSLPATARTGHYRVSLEIPGQKSAPLGSCSFSVEEFTPPRLAVTVTPGTRHFSPRAGLPVDLKAEYLFGAPGARLRYAFGYQTSPLAFRPEGFAEYVFGDGERPNHNWRELSCRSGNLDEQGAAALIFEAGDEWLPEALLRVQLFASVQEDGGRWTSQTAYATYSPTPYLLGLKDEGEGLRPGQPGKIAVAAVNLDGGAAEPGKLEVDISLVQTNWHTVYRDNRYAYTRNERILPLEKRKIASEKGLAEISFIPRTNGLYLVRVSAEDGSVTASRRFSAWSGDFSAEGDGGGRMGLVELSLDKDAYRAGESARLTVKAPFTGTLLLGTESGKQLSTRVLRLERPEAEVTIPVTEDMAPGSHVTAWVIRPVSKTDREWYAHRAYGAIPLVLSKAPHSLRVSVRPPERVLPQSSLSVPFTVTDENGVPVEGEFSAALIDEGILSLTEFETPDPLEYFFAPRRMVSAAYDFFDALLRPEAKATPRLTPGGDGAFVAHQRIRTQISFLDSPSTRQIVLAAYVPSIRTDADGQGEALFTLPEYSGTGRLMIVGASRDRFASAAVPVRVGRDVVLEASAPRAVAPGDVFDISLRLFSLSDKEADDGPPEKTGDGRERASASIPVPPPVQVAVRLSAEGPLELEGEQSFSLPLVLPKTGAAPFAHSFTAKARAGRGMGVTALTMRVEVPGREDLAFSKRLEIAVRPPYPRSGASVSALIPAGESATLAPPGRWLPHGASPAFSLGASPALAVLPALEYLRDYPHSCLEQLTSRAWPYLRPETAAQAPYGTNENNAKAMLANFVSSILALQLPDGGFSVWPGQENADPWRSVNAIFFLVEAKADTLIPPDALEEAYGYLRFLLIAPPESLGEESFAYSCKAFAAFVLTRAGQPPVSWLQHLSEFEDKMPPSGRIFLAGAKALKTGNPDALRALDGRIPASASIASGLNPSMESPLRNQSLLLYLWSLLAPTDPVATELCLDVASRLGRTEYLSTQEAGAVALALGAYLEATGGLAAHADYAAELSTERIPPLAVRGGQRSLLMGDALAPAPDGTPPPVTVSVSQGRAYAVYSLRGSPLTAPEPMSAGLALQRVWKDADGKVIDLSGGKVFLKKGDRVFVELTLDSDSPLADIAVSDLLPGGLECENPGLNIPALANVLAFDIGDLEFENPRPKSSVADKQKGEWEIWGEDWTPPPRTRMDAREDRLLLFFDRLAEKTVYRYSLRAVSSGTFVLPPLAAEAMYAPENRAIIPGGEVVIE